MQVPEQGPTGPQTEATKRLIENEWRAKMGLPPLTDPTQPTQAEVESLLALRQKWSEKDVESH